MARGRVIDKSIHLNEQLAGIPIEARYLYKGMIVHADDEGRMKASPAILKALIFPFDEATRIDTVKRWRDILASSGVIKLFAAGGQEYLVHPNWDRWQPLRKDRVRPSDCPASGDAVPVICRPLVVKPPPIPNPTQPYPTEPKNGVVSPPAVPDGPTPEDLVLLWNKTAHGNLPRVKFLTEPRKRQANCRLKENPGQAFWEGVMAKVNRSPLLRGESGSWKANFDWILNPTNLTKVVEGNYDERR